MEDGTETMLAIQSGDNPAADTFAFRSGGCAARIADPTTVID